MTAANTTTQNAAWLKSLERLARQLNELGLSIALYDQSHVPLLDSPSRGEFHAHFCKDGAPCAQAVAELVQRAWHERAGQTLETDCGCVFLATPVMQRRRVVAVATVWYLTGDAERREAFARRCDQLHLDRQYMASLVAQRPTHAATEARAMLAMIDMLIARELDNAVAQNELATLSANLSSTYEELSLLYRISGEMRVNASPREFFASVCAELLEVMQIHAAVAVLNDPRGGDHPAEVVRAGQLDLDDDQVRALAGRYVIPRLDGSARSHVANELTGRRYSQSVRNLIAAPLSAGDASHGLLLGLNKVHGDFDSVDLKLIKSVGNQAAVFLANYHLYEELQELLMGVLHVLTASIDAKDPYTCGHSQRVALISRKLAELCGFEPAAVRNIYLAGLLHDIGKIGVPETVLCKAGKLTDAEYGTMKRHPVIGANILSNIRQMKSVIPGVLHHHERIDGRGYPDGLSGQAIPMEGRIVGLADCFDAMTSSRTYRRALPLGSVLAEIMRCAGTQFDPVLVDHLLSVDLPRFLQEIREGEATPAAIRGAILGQAG